MILDLNAILKDWPFTPGELNIRKIEGEDGKDKVQMRIDLGLMQMELDGRPDGRTPDGFESYFASFKAEAEAARVDPTSEPFGLTADDCSKLQQEALQYYHRYLALFHLGDWDRVERDTTRNLKLFDFVSEHVEDQSIADAFQQFRPYVMMMLTRARANRVLGESRQVHALRIIDKGISDIETFFQNNSRPELIEQSQELHFLESWREEIESQKPLPEREKLEKQLNEAVACEDYERAAKLRDSIRGLETP